MTKPGMRHPPKKKHTAKPRPAPVIRLSVDEQQAKAQFELSKALTHLHEAEVAAVRGDTPNACVHSSYYAMHHCAIAVLLANGGVDKYGDVPASHEHVIEHFGKAVADVRPELINLGMLLGRARISRNEADYGLDYSASNADATNSARDARLFVDACGRNGASSRAISCIRR